MSRLKSVDRVCIAFAGEVRDALLLADIVLDDVEVILDITFWARDVSATAPYEVKTLE